MTSNPQLRADINRLQEENRALKARLAEIEQRPQKIVYRDGPERIITKRVEVPVERIVTKRVEVPVEKIVYRDKIVETPGPVRTVTKTVTEYKDKPETIDKLNKARAELRELRKKIKEAHENPRVVEVPVEKIVTKTRTVKGPVQYVDNPKLVDQIQKLRGMLNA